MGLTQWEQPRLEMSREDLVRGLTMLHGLQTTKGDLASLTAERCALVQHGIKGQVCRQCGNALRGSTASRAESAAGDIGGLGPTDCSDFGTVWALNLEAPQVWQCTVCVAGQPGYWVQGR